MKYTLSKGLNNSPDARAIRQSVFVEEQGFEYEFDDIDEIALHLVLYDENDNPCATGDVYKRQSWNRPTRFTCVGFKRET